MPDLNSGTFESASLQNTSPTRLSPIDHSGFLCALFVELLEEGFFFSFFREELFSIRGESDESAGGNDPTKVPFSTSSMNWERLYAAEPTAFKDGWFMYLDKNS